VQAYTLDGNDHLADLRLATVSGQASTVESEGLAAVWGYTQVTGRSFTHEFEVLLDNSGAKRTGLDVSVWNPGGGSLLGSLQSFDLTLTIPVADSRGIADQFAWHQIVGARRVRLVTDHMLAASGLVPMMTDMAAASLSGTVRPSVQVTFGALAFNLSMTLVSLEHRSERGAQQTYRAEFETRGAPTSVPTGSTLWGVAFSGDGLLTLNYDHGDGTYSAANAALSSLTLSGSRDGLITARGTLALQGAPTYA
jgi:hypothetical protein